MTFIKRTRPLFVSCVVAIHTLGFTDRYSLISLVAS